MLLSLQGQTGRWQKITDTGMGKEKITPNYEMLIKSKQHTDQVERTRRKRVRDSENSAPKQCQKKMP